MSDTDRLVLGIDGGGSNTQAIVADADGRTLGAGRSGPSNPKSAGLQAARRAINGSIAAAFAAAGRAVVPASSACLGLAGFDRPDERAMLESWAQEEGWAERLVLVNDCELVLAAGTPEGFGVGLIAGTGSICVGRSPDGKSARAGGWGHIFGDEGSAYSVAEAALRLVARRVDGREALRVLKSKSRVDHPADDDWGGPLGRRLCAAVGVAHPRQLVTAIYAPEFDRARIAALAPVVLESAEDDADVVPWILDPAAIELGQSVHAVVRAIGWGKPVLPLALAGSFLLSAEPVRDALAEYLRRFVPFEVLTSDVPEPVRGAVLLARKALD